MSLNKDKIAGLVLMILGLGAVIEGRGHTIGTLTQMGSGYFPVALGLVLVGIGFLIFVTASQGGQEKPISALVKLEEKEPAPLNLDHCPAPDFRGIGCIIASIICFISIGQAFGLVLATFASVFIAAIGDRTANLREAFMLALVMCALAIGLFHYGLHIQFPLFQFSLWKA
jgi:Tripartite tricarboxylate transporter TctB family